MALACQKLKPAGRIGDFGNFLNGFACFDGPEYWMNAILSWKIVKYCILYEVCKIKTAPRGTLCPQMWCIKKIRLVFTHPDLLATICKLVERKKFGLICFPRLIYCDQEASLLLKVTEDYFLGVHIRLYQLDTKFVSLQNQLAFPSKVTWMCP